MDAPQKVYDDPANLFVAQFLGAPPINTFEGRIEAGKVYIGDEAVMETTIADQEVYIGIRPEGFEIDPKGRFTVNIQNVEVMGRDISVIANHSACTKPTLRIIIDADNQVSNSGSLKLRIKPNKIFLFNKETEERLRENSEV
jgi:multiple sugar transport system ATP-binding protein